MTLKLLNEVCKLVGVHLMRQKALPLTWYTTLAKYNFT